MENNDLNRKAKEIEEGLARLQVKKTLSEGTKDKIAGERAFAEMVGGILFGLFFGFIFDDYFNTRPLFLIIFIFLGLAGSIYNIYKATCLDVDEKDQNSKN